MTSAGDAHTQAERSSAIKVGGRVPDVGGHFAKHPYENHGPLPAMTLPPSPYAYSVLGYEMKQESCSGNEAADTEGN